MGMTNCKKWESSEWQEGGKWEKEEEGRGRQQEKKKILLKAAACVLDRAWEFGQINRHALSSSPPSFLPLSIKTIK